MSQYSVKLKRNEVSEAEFHAGYESEARCVDETIRAMALEDVRDSAQKLKSDFLGQMETRLSSIMDDIVDSLQKTELPKKFMISDPVMMKDKRKASVAGKLPEKAFRSRPSPLTELLEVPHFKTIHHIFIATLVLIMLHTMILDLLETGTVDLGLQRLMCAFGSPQTVLGILLPLEFSTLFFIYPAFYFWATQRLQYKADTVKVIDRLAAFFFFLFMMGAIYLPAAVLWRNPLPPASGAAVTIEQCRLLMKMYAFVRSNIPRALKFEASRNNNMENYQREDHDAKKVKEESERNDRSSNGAVIQSQAAEAGTPIITVESTVNEKCGEPDPNEQGSLEGLRKRDVGGRELSSTTTLIVGGEVQKGISEVSQNGDKIHETPSAPKVNSWISWDDENSPCPQFSKYLYFFFAPTLIYKDAYPRTSRVRWDYVCWNFAQVFGCIVYGAFLLGRYCTAYLGNFGHPDHPMTVPQLLDALFSLMLPGMLGMVLGFFLLLHSWHNAWAEMLCFGDRLFYKDWWNQGSFASYYKTWNVLVHDWLYTYIFKDAWDSGLGQKYKFVPTSLVFIVSAIFHEYIISFSFMFFFPVLFILFGGFGFALFFIKNSNSSFGNVGMWMSLIAGTGILVTSYSMEFFARVNCPTTDEGVKDFFTLRFLTCNAVTWS